MERIGIEIAGVGNSASACFMKSPPQQTRDEAARRELERIIGGGWVEPETVDGPLPRDGDGAGLGDYRRIDIDDRDRDRKCESRGEGQTS